MYSTYLHNLHLHIIYMPILADKKFEEKIRQHALPLWPLHDFPEKYD
jgi:hypothetical protein